jgi:hypothetical protein
MKFHPNTTFIDYEGMPVSMNVPEEKRNSLYLKFTADRLEKYCLCWDQLPPRLMPADSALRNATSQCDEAEFRKLVQQCLMEKNQSDTKQLLLYEYWFKDDGSDNKWKDWLSNITDDEIIILVSSLDPQITKHRDGQDDAAIKRFNAELLISFNSSLALTHYLNQSFLFFLQDLSVRVNRLLTK